MDKEKYFPQSLFEGISDLFKLSPCTILEWKQTSWQAKLGFGNLSAMKGSGRELILPGCVNHRACSPLVVLGNSSEFWDGNKKSAQELFPSSCTSRAHHDLDSEEVLTGQGEVSISNNS